MSMGRATRGRPDSTASVLDAHFLASTFAVILPVGRGKRSQLGIKLLTEGC